VLQVSQRECVRKNESPGAMVSRGCAATLRLGVTGIQLILQHEREGSVGVKARQ
jgi:hypothetical protein